MRIASALSATAALTRFSPLIRRREVRGTGRGLLLFSDFKKWGSRVAWMGRKLQHEAQLCPCVASVRIPSGTRSDGGNDIKSPAVEAEENDSVNSGRSSLMVVSFYKFADLPDYAEMRTPLRELCDTHVRCLPSSLFC